MTKRHTKERRKRERDNVCKRERVCERDSDRERGIDCVTEREIMCVRGKVSVKEIVTERLCYRER